MQRYFVEPECMSEGTVRLVREDAHHLIRVMRCGPGDEFICSDGRSREVLARVVRVEKETVHAEVVRELPMDREPAVEVWIAQSLPKGDKLETVIQKCTELGAARFIPFVSERTIVQYDEKKESKRLERWRKIAKEAAEQSHRNRVPLVESPWTWPRLMEEVATGGLSIFCYEQEDGSDLRSILDEAFGRMGENKRTASDKRVLVIVGPEGGFSQREAGEAVRAGCRSASLGKRILRTETAAMAALTCILYHTGEMGG